VSERVEVVEAARVIDAELAAEIERQAAWVSARVSDLRVDGDGRAVRFLVADGGVIADERAKVARFVSAMAERHRVVPRKVVLRRERAGRAVARDVFGELLRRGWAVELGRGRVSLRGPALAVVRAIDEDAARIARRMGAIEEAHPSLVPAALLARCGTFASFPHTVSLVTHLAEDYDVVEAFRRSAAEAGAWVEPPREAVASFEACLLPALCYAIYAAREGSTLPEGGAVVTCAGRCVRYESRNLAGVERLWEFGMRELVFLGAEQRCADGRRRALEAVLDQLERWDLDGVVESASDPFFAAARGPRAYWQRSGDRKLELHMPVAPADAPGSEPRRIACASFNLHDRFFGSAFAIVAADGGPASSGCVGWGLERWMLACFAQHGFDAAGWPSWLADRVFP
jgi:seryl-tRNA synthetase